MPKTVNLTVGTISGAGQQLVANISENIGVLDRVTAVLDPVAFVLGDTRPTATNTGIPAGRPPMTVINSDFVCAPNADYYDLDINGFVTGASGARMFYCRFRGRGTTFITDDLVYYGGGGAGFYMENCEFDPSTPKYYYNGFDGSDITAYRCKFSRLTDGGHWTGNRCKAWGCYFDSCAIWDGSGIPNTNVNGSDHPSDSRYPGMNHADTIQVMGGTGHEIIGNTCRGYWDLSAGTPASLQPWSRGGSANGKYHPKYNGCNNLTICPNNALITNLKIQKNWIDGGECGMQMPAQGKGFDTGNTVDFSDNRFGVTMFPWNGLDYVQARWTTGIATFTGLGTNIFDNTVDVPSDLVGAPLVGSPGSYKVRL